MSDAVGRGITVTEIMAIDQAVDVSPETTVAFIGRALRGPVNTPVLVTSFGEFRRHFGDVWRQSSLAPAAQMFFESGGRKLYVVRVANNARGALLCLPANGSALLLRALEPGSTERLRAAVDFDGIADDDEEHFNLTLQRLNPDTHRVIDQELHLRVSYLENSADSVIDSLLTSTLARAMAPLPAHRPQATTSEDSRYQLTYVAHAEDGTDGAELTDYDLIGSTKNASGLFALQQLECLDLLYLPPPGKGRDPGPAAVMAAERFCRERGAMLIIDPPAHWLCIDDALRGSRELAYASPNMLSVYPRLIARDAGDDVARGAGAALAGLLCKLDRLYGSWQPLDQQGLELSRRWQPAETLDDDDASALARNGWNAICKGPKGRARVLGSVTLARGRETHREQAALPVRRLCLKLAAIVDQATRWAVFARADARLGERVTATVSAHLAELEAMGAFAEGGFHVHCDTGRSVSGVVVHVRFEPSGGAPTVRFSLHQLASGCRLTSTAFGPIDAAAARA